MAYGLPAGLPLQRVGYKVGILIGLMVTALGALLFIPSASMGQFLPFVLSMFVLASGLACLETAADSYVNVLGPPELASRRLNLAQSFNGLGTFIGPLIGGSLFFKGTAAGEGAHDNVQLIYAIIGVAIAVFAMVVGRAHLPEIAEPEHAGDGADGRPLMPLTELRQGAGFTASSVGNVRIPTVTSIPIAIEIGCNVQHLGYHHDDASPPSADGGWPADAGSGPRHRCGHPGGGDRHLPDRRL
ncbi:MFS transporter [Nitrospirillum amazonense]|uniref:MFS transporter n=1 Tax=Nitrospirillum amazonense TaxID=28077 RepID=UPI0011AA9075|nr:MFS transporter [Nitrospirillum amazonense]